MGTIWQPLASTAVTGAASHWTVRRPPTAVDRCPLRLSRPKGRGSLTSGQCTAATPVGSSTRRSRRSTVERRASSRSRGRGRRASRQLPRTARRSPRARAVPGDAARDRRHAVSQHAVQSRRRARRATGREFWSYDPKAYEAGQPSNGTGFVHRGVATWTRREAAADSHQQPLAAHRARRGDRTTRFRRSARTARSTSRANILLERRTSSTTRTRRRRSCRATS